MADTVSKTDNFLRAIEKYAEEQRTKIQSEAEDFREKELNKAEEEGLREAYVLIRKKMSDINIQISSELSKAESASRKKTFICRKEISDKVFEDAEKKLIEFTKTPKYLETLKKSAFAIGERLKSDDVVLMVSERDLKFKDEIAESFKNAGGYEVYEIISDSSISIGGITGLSRKLGLLADETLDTKLDEQHEWFYENSGLKVTE